MTNHLSTRAGLIVAAGALTVGPEWVLIAVREGGNGLAAGVGYAWRAVAIACILPACWLLAEFGYALLPQRVVGAVAAGFSSLWRRRSGHVLAFALFLGGTLALSWTIAVSLWKDLDLPYFLPAIPWEVEVRRLTSRLPAIVAVGAALGALLGFESARRRGDPPRGPWLIRHLAPVAISMGFILSIINVARPLGYFASFHPVLLLLAFWSYLLGLSTARLRSGRSRGGVGGRFALVALPAAAVVGTWLLTAHLGGPPAASLRTFDLHRPLAAKLAVAAFASRHQPQGPLVCPPASASTVRGSIAADVVAATGGATATSSGLPDLLFVTVDALSAHHVGSLGYGRDATPSLDRLAGEGLSFSAARSTGSATEVGIPGILFSRPYECVQGQPDPLPSVFSELDAAGYRTSAFYGYPMGEGVTAEYGPALLEAFDRREFLGRDAAFPNTYSPDDDVAAAALGELESAPADRPLGMWVHFYNPHPVYNPPESTRGRFGRAQPARYDEEVLATDAAFGRVWDAWRTSRPGRELVVVVTADHAQALHELGQHGHATALVHSMVHVPLIIRASGVDPGTVSRPVSTLDVGPTTLELLGLPVPPSFMGASLVDLANTPSDPSSTPPDNPVWMTRADVVSGVITEAVVLGHDKLYREARPRYALLFPEGEYYALYDMSSDSLERHNLVDEEPERVARLKPLLLSRMLASPGSGG